MTHSSRLRVSKLSLGLLVCLAAAPAFAQSTSAGLSGTVVGADGRPVANQVVTITHTESGTTSRVTTDSKGQYSASGLRVGGPYTVATEGGSETGVYLNVSNENSVNITTAGAGTNAATAPTSVGVVRISGAGRQIFNNNKMGSGTAVNRRTIEALPSVGGNIQDYMRLDPRVAFVDRASGTISAGGQNPRFNSIQVDGISASDTFGLEGNNMSTRRQPVSMDAIEALSVELSSYDTSITGATGAVVNAVTKSGTNNFHGSIYGTYRDGDWFGKDPLRRTFNGFNEEQTYGATFGGPIVKDKLFFFANYEKFHQGAPGVDLSSTAVGKSGAIITQADLDRAAAIASTFGINAGTLESTGDMDLEEYGLKIDWNISEKHRFSFRYSNLEQSKLRVNGMSNSSVSLSSYWYQHNKTVENYVAQLFSDWTDTFSTEAKVSYNEYSAVRDIPTNAPSVEILFGGTESSPSGDSIFLGTETNSQANQLFTETWRANLVAKWDFDSHDIKIGADFSTNKIYNIYAPQTYGIYRFAGLDNFAAGKWSSYDLRTPQPGLGVESMAADYTYDTIGLFAQDTWRVTDRLTVNYGLRADRPSVNTKPAYNAAAEAVFGYDNSFVIKNDWLVQPRVGFNYRLDTTRPSQIRGGIGLFSGDAPQVWLSNSYNTTGFNYIQYSQQLSSAENWQQLPFNGDGSNQPVPTTPGSSLINVNYVSPDFEQPAVWKANLAFETTLPWYGVIASAELLYTKVKSALIYKHLNLGDPTFEAQDGRDMFWGTNASGVCTATPKFGSAWSSGDNRCLRNRAYDTVYMIDTTDKGYSNQMTLSLAKPFTTSSDWSWYAGYTFTDAKEVSGLTSSTASSGWNYNYIHDANEEKLSTARYEIRHRLSGNLNWRHKFFGDYTTSVGVVYEGRTGRPYSYVYSNDVNGDNRSGNDLFYVPSGPGDVMFGRFTGGAFVADPAMETAFFQWLEQQDELNNFKGRYAPQNSGRATWVNTFDVRISQELPGFFRGNKAEIWLDIQNVGNLINKDWGHIMDYGFFANQRVLASPGMVDGKYVYTFTNPDAASPANADSDGFNVGVSQWSAQIGFRYKF